MREFAGFPYAEIELGKSGEIVDRSSYDELLAALAGPEAPTDVLVVAHGWNNNTEEARGWYEELAGHFRDVLGSHAPAGLAGRRFAIVGVLWPSKKFTEAKLIPGGAASFGGGVADADLQSRLTSLQGVFDALDADERLAKAAGEVPDLEDSPAARDRFVELLRGALDDSPDGDDFPSGYRRDAGRDVLAALEAPVLVGGGGADAPGGGTATSLGERSAVEPDGAAAGFSLSLSGIKAAAERFLNLTTYYQMKDRAGRVGVAVSPVLSELRPEGKEIRIHLVGHSFGGRLVTAATAGAEGSAPLRPDTVTLLQAAFSHFGFASKYDEEHDGFFRRMVTDRLVGGPVLITHSVRDTAVGYAYPLASRLAGQAAAGLGDADDRFGGIGRNGAQKTPEAIAEELLAVGQPYAFQEGKLHNLRADKLITDHSAIRTPEVAYAVLSAVAVT
jgi:hypothetical protein